MMIYKCDAKTGEVIERFDTVKEISSARNIQRVFANVLGGKVRAYKGFLWCYAKDYNEDWVKAHLDPEMFVPTPSIKRQGVLALKKNGTSQRFTSLDKASKFFKRSTPFIRTLIEKKREYEGYTFEWD